MNRYDPKPTATLHGYYDQLRLISFVSRITYISFQKSLLLKPFYKLLGLRRSWIKQLLLIILRYTSS